MDTATAIVDLLSVALMVRNTIYSCIMNETVDADRGCYQTSEWTNQIRRHIGNMSQ